MKILLISLFCILLQGCFKKEPMADCVHFVGVHVENAITNSDVSIAAINCGVNVNAKDFLYGQCDGSEPGDAFSMAENELSYTEAGIGIDCSNPLFNRAGTYAVVSSLRIDIGDVPGERQVFVGWPKTMLDVAALGYDNDDHIQYGFAYIRSSIGAETELNPGVYYDPLYIVLSKNSQNEYVLNIDESRSVVQTQPVGLR